MMTTYWAQLDTNNIVVKVFTGVDDLTIEGIPTGEWYSNLVKATCVQTFMDDPNKIYAGIGFAYSYNTKDFIVPLPTSPPVD